jgi:hypothetical protein
MKRNTYKDSARNLQSSSFRHYNLPFLRAKETKYGLRVESEPDIIKYIFNY